MNTIDVTPTWGEWANMYATFAASGERKVCKGLRADLAKMAAAAQALNEIRAELPEHLQDRASRCLVAELQKQGF
ncbi:hypothetical protein [Achromobacter sp. DH1f]|uniref:hypothetical protein n=1 Tax=Achromobacter sp. DH1f TaxID=1397275 RepID=UPI00046A4DF2|nr:hypothetical protein [Achromobacter sp. DH1f]